MTNDTASDESDDQPDYCPHCNAFDTIEERGEDDTPICTICYTTLDGAVRPFIGVDESVDFSNDPHEQSIRPRYANAVEHGRAKQVVLYGAFGYDPPLASIEPARGKKLSAESI
jgi:hypothetical protein